LGWFVVLVALNILLFYEILKNIYRATFYASLKLFLVYILISTLFITSPLIVRFLKEAYILKFTPIHARNYCNEKDVSLCKPSLLCEVDSCEVSLSGLACMALPSCGLKTKYFYIYK
jgi:hypothetical protein